MENGNKPEKKRERMVKPWHIALFAGGMAAVLLAMVAFVGVIQLALGRAKDTEEYVLAYECFIRSETWDNLGAEESEIRLNRYSSHTDFSRGTGEGVKTTELSFMVRGQFFKVVCRRDDGVWRILETNFD